MVMLQVVLIYLLLLIPSANGVNDVLYKKEIYAKI